MIVLVPFSPPVPFIQLVHLYIRVLFPELIFGEVLPYVECTKINAFPIHICCLTFQFFLIGKGGGVKISVVDIKHYENIWTMSVKLSQDCN